jgi:hypothetical protein
VHRTNLSLLSGPFEFPMQSRVFASAFRMKQPRGFFERGISLFAASIRTSKMEIFAAISSRVQRRAETMWIKQN